MELQVVRFVGNVVWEYLLTIYIAAVYIVLQFFRKHRVPQGLLKKDGQVAIVTGGNRGIGLEVVQQLLDLHMHVIIGCRNPQGIDELLDNLSTKYPKAKVEAIELDVSSLKSVKQFVDRFYGKNLPLHVLINNAGVMFPPYELTEDGFESQLGINYLGHFLLTYLLLPKLKETGKPTEKARIVNVSSCVALIGKINLDDLQSKEMYSPHGCYSQSKLAQVMFSVSLQEQLLAESANVTVNSLHPGVVRTDLYQHVFMFRLIPMRLLFKSSKQGSDTVVYVAVSGDLEGVGGRYYENCCDVPLPAHIRDSKLRQQLWEHSSKLVGIAAQ